MEVVRMVWECVNRFLGKGRYESKVALLFGHNAISLTVILNFTLSPFSLTAKPEASGKAAARSVLNSSLSGRRKMIANGISPLACSVGGKFGECLWPDMNIPVE
jgi:hypothetical protein